jgi:hypothetical protein
MNEAWSIQLIKETHDGVLVSASDGETAWLSHEEYRRLLDKN